MRTWTCFAIIFLAIACQEEERALNSATVNLNGNNYYIFEPYSTEIASSCYFIGDQLRCSLYGENGDLSFSINPELGTDVTVGTYTYGPPLGTGPMIEITVYVGGVEYSNDDFWTQTIVLQRLDDERVSGTLDANVTDGESTYNMTGEFDIMFVPG